MQEKSLFIKYQGSQIELYSDERNDYVSLTDMAKAFKGNKSIESWMRNKNTLNFLAAWERYNNPKFVTAGFDDLLKKAGRQHFNLSIKVWSDTTNAIGIFTKFGVLAGTYAHKDIAFKFASWLSPDFELFLIREVQRLKELDEQTKNFELLNHEQILYLVQLKEVFKYVAHQEVVEDAHKEVFAARSASANPFAEFHGWRNKILGLDPNEVNERIKKYCIDNRIALSDRILRKSRREKVLMLDTYEAVRNAVWDFLEIKGEVNSLNLANLVRDIIRTEHGEVKRKNEDNLFEEKQDLGVFSDFPKQLAGVKQVKAAREILLLRQGKA